MAYRKNICFKVIIGLQNENRHLGLNMLTQSRPSWSRKPGCCSRMSGSCANTPWAAVGLLLMSVVWPKPHQTQNAPVRTMLTEAKGPSSSRSLLQLMSIQSWGKKVREEQVHSFPSTLSQLLLGRDSQWPHCGGLWGCFTPFICWFVFHLYQVKLNLLSLSWWWFCTMLELNFGYILVKAFGVCVLKFYSLV